MFTTSFNLGGVIGPLIGAFLLPVLGKVAMRRFDPPHQTASAAIILSSVDYDQQQPEDAVSSEGSRTSNASAVDSHSPLATGACTINRPLITMHD